MECSYERWHDAGYALIMGDKTKAKPVTRPGWPYRSSAFVRVGVQWTKHEVIGHPLIFNRVGDSKLVTVFCEVKITVKTVGEWHGELQLLTTGSSAQSTSLLDGGCSHS
jgi:hypothetical protein